MTRGRLITLEGGEGAGKTTAIKSICDVLQSWNVEYICTREPGGEKTAERIRSILLDTEHLHSKTELLLMFAARNEHIENIIKPNINKGIWVVSDRYVDASYAYQGGGRGLGFNTVKWLDDFIVGKSQADLTLLMDIDPVIGMQRVKSRGAARDRIEKEPLDFFQKIAMAYHEKAKLRPQNYEVIDASKSISKVQEIIVNALALHKKRLL